MSVAAVAWAFEQKLPPNEKVVLLALADCENGQTAICIPGQERIAEMSTMSVRSVRRMLERLEERGLIQREHRTSLSTGYRTSDSYVLALRDNLAGRAEPSGQNEQANRSTVAGIREPEEEPEDTPPTPSVDDVVPEWFDEAWASWPRKDGRAAARKAWVKASKLHRRALLAGDVPQGPNGIDGWGDQALLRDTVKRFAAAYSRNTPPRFIPHLSTWLNQERWSDPLPVSQERGARQAEPPTKKPFTVPLGHRVVLDPITGHITGTEPITKEES